MTRTAWADSWALLIGIDQYEDTNHIASLGGASADARGLARTLVSAAGFPEEHVKVLASDGEVKPTRTNILNELARLTKNAKPGDTVFVLYSGHGIDIGGTPYLLPYDTSALDDDTVTDTALETAKFRARLAQVKAKALVLAFDMCRSDPRKSGKGVTTPDNKLTRTLARGLDFGHAADGSGNAGTTSAASPIAVTLYSCAEGERSYEWQDKGRGYFSYYLEQGLRGAAADGAGHVTVGSLAQYVEKNVKSAVAREEHHDQTPYPSLDGPGATDFVLVQTTTSAPGTGRTTTAVSIRPMETPVATPLDTAAYLTVNVNAPNATVLVDGKPILPGAETRIDLGLDKTRQVEIGVAAANYVAVRKSVKLTAGARFALPVKLAVALTPPDVLFKNVTPAVAAGSAATTAPTAKTTLVAPLHLHTGILQGHSVPLRAAAISPDGKYLASGSTDGLVILWNAATGEPAHQLRGHTFEVDSVAFSRDSRFLLTASGDGTVKVWDTATGQQTQVTQGNPGALSGASFSPDGKHIVAGSLGTLHVWNVATGEEEHAFPIHKDTVFAATYAPDGKTILSSAADNTAKISDATTGKVLRTLSGHTGFVNAANFSPDGRFVVTGSEDKTAKIWDAATGRELRTLRGHENEIKAAAFSPDGKYVVTGSLDQTARVWDAATGQQVRVFRGPGVFAAAFSPDGRYIVTGNADETVRVWDVSR